MPLSRDADYVSYLYTCNRCRSCVVDSSPERRPVCPSFEKFGFFAYSGGGKGYVAQGILEGRIPPGPEALEVAMNCLLCDACGSSCPPGFDTRSFIRDLRDHLVGRGLTLNAKHRELLALARGGSPWGEKVESGKFPPYTGAEELLVFAGCREGARGELRDSLERIFSAAGVSWGVLEAEPCCGAPLLDLGDRAAFERLARQNVELLNAAGAGRVLALCPHCAATLTHDTFAVGEFEFEVVSLPRVLAELLEAGRLALTPGKQLEVTFHDPCRLSRFLEEGEESRTLIDAMPGVKRVEMDRSGKSSWCCGSGAWAAEIVPDLSRFAAGERAAEARATGAGCIVTACSYCTDSLRRATRGKPRVTHLAEMVADRVRVPKPKREKAEGRKAGSGKG